MRKNINYLKIILMAIVSSCMVFPFAISPTCSATDSTQNLTSSSSSNENSEITQVKIKGANLHCIIGNLPPFGAWIDDTDNSQCKIMYEMWEEVDGNDDATWSWFSDESPTYKECQKDKEYYYSIRLKAEEGKKFSDKTTILFDGKPLDKSKLTFEENNTEIIARRIFWTQATSPLCVNKIYIDNVFLDFKAGDKPKFTGQVPEGVPYEICYESWIGSDKTVSSSSEGEQEHFIKCGYEPIEVFKPGVTYTYNAGIVLTEKGKKLGYKFNPRTVSVKINNEITNYSTDPDYELADPFSNAEDLNLVNVVEIKPLEKQESKSTEISENKDGSITFHVDKEAEKLDTITIDNQTLDKKDYTVASGSTLVTLNSSYLKSLESGEHKITFNYTDDNFTTKFFVDNNVNKTKIYILLALGIGLIVVLVMIFHKRRMNFKK